MEIEQTRLPDDFDYAEYNRSITSLRKSKGLTLQKLSDKAKDMGIDGCGINNLNLVEKDSAANQNRTAFWVYPILLDCEDKTPQGLINEAAALSKKDPLPKDMGQFGASIAIVRESRGWDQNKLAEELAKLAKQGCNKNIVSDMENGRPVNPIWPPLVSQALNCRQKTMRGVIAEADKVAATDHNKIPDDLGTLGKNITTVRKNRGYEREELAEHSRVNIKVVAKAERGEPVSKESLIKIAHGLKCKEPTIAGIAAEIHIMDKRLVEQTKGDIAADDAIKPASTPKPSAQKKPEDYLSANGISEYIEGLRHEQAWRLINKHMISGGYTIKDIASKIHVPDELVRKAYQVISKDEAKRAEAVYLKEEYMLAIPKIFLREHGKRNYTELERQAVGMPVLSMKNISAALQHFALRSEHEIDGLDQVMSPKQAYGIAKNRLGFNSLAEMVSKWEKETGKGGGKGSKNTIGDDAIDLSESSWVARIGGNDPRSRTRTSFSNSL